LAEFDDIVGIFKYTYSRRILAEFEEEFLNLYLTDLTIIKLHPACSRASLINCLDGWMKGEIHINI
jgi:hypothetical protein